MVRIKLLTPAFFFLLLPSTAFAATLDAYSAHDGDAYRSGVTDTFSQIHDGNGTNSFTDVDVAQGPYLGANAAVTYAQMRRQISCFDTSALGSSATISAVELSYKGDGSSNTDDFSQSVVVDEPHPGSTSTFADSDYNIANWDVVEQATSRIAVASWDVTNRNTFTLNSTGRGNINKTGVTCFGLRFSSDFDNSEPGFVSDGGSTLHLTITNSTTTDRPLLHITYTLPSSSSASSASSSSSSGSGSSSSINLNNSGSLILFHNYCNVFAGTGSSATCTDWDTSIVIPAIKSFQSLYAYNVRAAQIILIKYFFVFIMLFIAAKWFFRIITLKGIPRYRR